MRNNSTVLHALDKLGTRIPILGYNHRQLSDSCGILHRVNSTQLNINFLTLLAKSCSSESLVLVNETTSPRGLSTTGTVLALNQDEPINSIKISNDNDVVRCLAWNGVLVETPRVGTLRNIIIVSCLIKIEEWIHTKCLGLLEKRRKRYIKIIHFGRKLEELLTIMLGNFNVALAHHAMIADTSNCTNELELSGKIGIARRIILARKLGMAERHGNCTRSNLVNGNAEHVLGIILCEEIKFHTSEIGNTGMFGNLLLGEIKRKRSKKRIKCGRHFIWDNDIYIYL